MNLGACALLFTTVVAATGCGGQTSGSSDDGPDADGPAFTPGQPGQTSFTAAEVTAAQSVCPNFGLNEDFPNVTTVGGFRDQMVGAWWLCPGGSAIGGPIVITSDGRWLDLVSDGSGGLVLGTTAAGESTYVIDTVFDGQSILDGGAGQVLGPTTKVRVVGEDGVQHSLQVDPLQDPPRLDVWPTSDPYGEGGWSYVQLAGP